MLSVWLNRNAARNLRKGWWADTVFEPCTTVLRRYALKKGKDPETLRKEDMGLMPWDAIERWEWMEEIHDNFLPAGFYRTGVSKILIRNSPARDGKPCQLVAVHASSFEDLRRALGVIRGGALEQVH